MALTGANVAFGKVIAAAVPVHIFVLFRLAVASLALAPMVRSEPGPQLARMNFGHWRDLVLMAMLGLVGFTVLMLEGLKRTAAADAGIITATLPAVVAALGVLFAGERLSRLQATAVGLSVAGLLLVQALSVQGGSTTLLDKPARIAGAVLVIGGIVLGALSPTAPYRR
jgi:drug/metabolite transporter (DMT)-like permease